MISWIFTVISSSMDSETVRSDRSSIDDRTRRRSECTRFDGPLARQVLRGFDQSWKEGRRSGSLEENRATVAAWRAESPPTSEYRSGSLFDPVVRRSA